MEGKKINKRMRHIVEGGKDDLILPSRFLVPISIPAHAPALGAGEERSIGVMVL